MAHIQRNETVVELAGDTEQDTHVSVYHWLVQRAQDIGGWLITHTIWEDEEEPVSQPTEDVRTSQPEEDSTIRLGDSQAWGTYTSTFEEAMPFKENSNG